jgi:uncharacterized short protein YbdD (DUF466 family)
MRIDDGAVIARPRSGRGDLGETASAAAPPRNDSRLRHWLGALKRICGMPDYPGYLDHMAARHPGCAVISERQFYDEQVMARYGNGASRCC